MVAWVLPLSLSLSLAACAGASAGGAEEAPSGTEADGGPSTQEPGAGADAGAPGRDGGDGGETAKDAAPSTPFLPRVAVGEGHACATTAKGGVMCWGQNGSGQLGDGTKTPSDTPVAVVGITDAVDLAAGNQFSCALHATGGVSCWGNPQDGRLGSTSPGDGLMPRPVAGLTDVVALSAAREATCAVRKAGTVSCWGSGLFGEMGNGAQVPGQSSPKSVNGIDDAASVSGAYHHFCVLTKTGQVKCWGENNEYQCGEAPVGLRLRPVSVAGIVDATALATLYQGTCVLEAAGQLVCWGGFANRQSAGSMAPLLSGASALAGGSFGPCGVVGGAVTCSDGTTPKPIVGIVDAVRVVGSSTVRCAVRATGGIACWSYFGAPTAVPGFP